METGEGVKMEATGWNRGDGNRFENGEVGKVGWGTGTGEKSGYRGKNRGMGGNIEKEERGP